MDRLPPWAVRLVATVLIGAAGWFLRDAYERNLADHEKFRDREQNLGERLSVLESEVHYIRGQ